MLENHSLKYRQMAFVVGPRQVGKTHLLRELEATIGRGVVYAAADAPPAALPGWWELQWREARRLTTMGRSSVLMIDEIQHLPEDVLRLPPLGNHYESARSLFHLQLPAIVDRARVAFGMG